MIQTETIERTIRNRTVQLTHTWSDSGMRIAKNGTCEVYDDALDLSSSGYTYTETDEPIAKEE